VGRGWRWLKLLISGPDLERSGLRRDVWFVIKTCGFHWGFLRDGQDER
jgi:hypothetical protein